jgi:putative ABC transport system permease protein
MAYAVARRTAEIGIRMALGARSQEVVWLILRETLWLVLCGVVSGVPLAIWFARYTRSLLFGIAPADPLVIAAATVVLIGSAALAAFLPARQASRIDPMVALRYE